MGEGLQHKTQTRRRTTRRDATHRAAQRWALTLALTLALAAASGLTPPRAAWAEDEEAAAQATPAPTPAPAVVASARSALASARGLLSMAATPPEPLTAEAILSASRTLRAGLSLGTTSAGSVHSAAAIDPRGKRLGVLATHIDRGRTYGSASLVALLQDAADEVARQHPGSRVIVGDLSAPRGGKVSGHRSHQAGRDVDVVFFYKDAKGKPTEATGMWRVRASGETSDGLTFDARRGWTLVRALLTHPTAQVQYVFVAKHLRAQLLAEAARQGAPPALIARAEEILRQPSDSAPHDDHFHVRVLCDRDERLEGCLNRGRLWPWADLHEGPLLRRAQALIAALPALPAEDAARAIELLLRLEADVAAPWLAASLPALPHPTRALAAQALGTLPRLAASPSSARALALSLALLTQALPALTEPSDRAEVPALLLAATATHPALAKTLTAALLQDATARGDEALALATLRATSAPPPPLPALAFVPLWLEQLEGASPALHAAAAQSLRDATHHQPPPLLLPADAAAHWRTWWTDHQALPAQELLLLGLRGYGLHAPSLTSTDAIPALIEAQTATPPATALAAHAALTKLTKHDGVASALAPGERQRLWSAWLAKQKKKGGKKASGKKASGKKGG